MDEEESDALARRVLNFHSAAALHTIDYYGFVFSLYLSLSLSLSHSLSLTLSLSLSLTHYLSLSAAQHGRVRALDRQIKKAPIVSRLLQRGK